VRSPGNVLARFYQKHQTGWDQAFVSGGLALLFAWFATEMNVYSAEWRVTLTAAIFLVGWQWPAWGYVIFVASLALPLEALSIYLAALALAVLILPTRWIVRQLGALLLILVAPALLPWHLAPVVPLLAGLWWSERQSASVGGIAALWIKLCAGMAGQSLDLNELAGHTLSLAPIEDRFHTANSLQTVQWLVEPFSTQLLLHVLQVTLWAVVSYTVCWAQGRFRDRRFLGPLLSAGLGGGTLAAGHLSLAAWLNPGVLAFDADAGWHWGSFLLAALIAGGVYQAWQYLQLPLIPRSSSATRYFDPLPPQRSSASADVTSSSRSLSPRMWLRQVKTQPIAENEDLILIELDPPGSIDQNQDGRKLCGQNNDPKHPHGNARGHN